MQDFALYFELGWQHILDWQGYDHILFVLVLCCSYTLTDWRKILLLVTAFTIGHSLTLALSVLNFVRVNSAWIEFMIPLTILVTTSLNIIGRKTKKTGSWLKYTLTLFFGLIHGMGFSNYLKSLLGKSTNIATELFAFNIGLEFGQLMIVLISLATSFFLINLIKITQKDWIFFLSSAIFGISFIMSAERLAALL
ncbi:HupE/UreJ family protein [Pedobacter sp. MC2016-14]|uniref:HupE/UreJ family protein n=1 Tax=Pedobacter sp. MC2016-14 TaxID=2897327 RepID=UPI001E2EBB89|nr:HupE/UreJ family protein [Pedobacter sp. MC2016-14]MCD0490441.1 HupE/UreJ family protein [Pedobacter sp. MC2016-14]